MKYCPNCGAEVQNDTNTCLACGKELKTVTIDNQTNNAMAITGFILALVSLFLNFWGIVGILATVFSAIGLSQTKKLNGKGKGMAIAGLIIGIFSILYGLYTIVALVSIFS